VVTPDPLVVLVVKGKTDERESMMDENGGGEFLIASFDGVTLTKAGEDGDFSVRVRGEEGCWSFCRGDLPGAVKHFAEAAGLPWRVVWGQREGGGRI
jgi:hypothetical protein